MNIAYYHVDCFTEKRFCGNPAAVCLLPEWLPDITMQTMAAEHNLPATAFIKAEVDNYAIRWFGPENEIPLCGHGSIAAAYVIFKLLYPHWQEVIFKSPLYTIKVRHSNNYLLLDFPRQYLERAKTSEELINALGVKPLEVYSKNTCLAVLESQQQVANVNAKASAMRNLPYRNLIITAPGENVDFVSRNFYPKKISTEDPVTGSAHCILAPYWAKRLNKNSLTAQQLSARGGDLICEVNNESVLISGKAVLYQKGELNI